MSPSTPVKPLPELKDCTSLAKVETPKTARSIAPLAFVFFLITAISMAFVPWQQTAPGKGRVIAFTPNERQQTVEAPVEGRVERWHVREGSKVKAGDPLVDLQDVDPGLSKRLGQEVEALRGRIAAAEARAASLESRRSSLDASRKRAMAGATARRKMAKDRTRAANEAVAAATAARNTAKLNLERQRKLEQRGLAAVRARELAELDATRAETDLARADAALAAARSEEAALEADLGKADTDGSAAIEDAKAARASALAEASSARAELARVEVRMSRQTSQAVRAPRDGVVLRLVAFQGSEILKQGDPLVVMVPNTESRAVEIWVSGNDAPLITPGRHVRIQFEGWPAIQFSGWPSVAVGTFGGEVSFVDATDDGSGRFRVVIVPTASEPWPDARYLRQGVRVNSWVVLNQVALGYELWRQFNGFPPALDEEAKDEKSKSEPKVDAPAKKLRK